jgi:hypothetical protein
VPVSQGDPRGATRPDRPLTSASARAQLLVSQVRRRCHSGAHGSGGSRSPVRLPARIANATPPWSTPGYSVGAARCGEDYERLGEALALRCTVAGLPKGRPRADKQVLIPLRAAYAALACAACAALPGPNPTMVSEARRWHWPPTPARPPDRRQTLPHKIIAQGWRVRRLALIASDCEVEPASGAQGDVNA